MDAENEKLLKNYRNLIKNQNISVEKFVDAWVSHVNPGQNSEEDPENSERSNFQNDDDDVTFLDPCDSASQVGNIGQQIQKFFEGRGLFNLRNGSTPPHKIPQRILKLVAYIQDGQKADVKTSPVTKKFKSDDVPTVTRPSAEPSNKKSVSNQSPNRKIPSTSTSKSYKSTLENRSPVKNAEQENLYDEEEKNEQEDENLENDEDDSFSKSYVSASGDDEGDMLDHSDDEKSDYRADNCKNLEQAGGDNVTIPEVERDQEISETHAKTSVPTTHLVKITKQSVSTLVGHYTNLDYDETFVDAVHAAGFVFMRRVLKNLEDTATNNNQNCIKRQDVIDLYKKLGLNYDEDDFKRIEEVFQAKQK